MHGVVIESEAAGTIESVCTAAAKTAEPGKLRDIGRGSERRTPANNADGFGNRDKIAPALLADGQRTDIFEEFSANAARRGKNYRGQ